MCVYSNYSFQDEIDEGSSPELREAKAAWSLIMDNFEEFKKVRDLHKHMYLYMYAYI